MKDEPISNPFEIVVKRFRNNNNEGAPKWKSVHVFFGKGNGNEIQTLTNSPNTIKNDQGQVFLAYVESNQINDSNGLLDKKKLYNKRRI